jgi:hypothetical protein
MIRTSLPTTFAASLLGLAFLFASTSRAADLSSLAGTYAIISVTTTQPSGEKVQPFGARPVGILMLARDGRYMSALMKADLPKIAANNREKGTPDEMKAIVAGSITHMGTISVQGDTMIFNIEHSTFPNWDGTTQKREFSVSGDILTVRVPAASGGGTGEVVWGRLK